MAKKSPFRIYIIGVPGTGKTSVGKTLSAKLDLKLIEINDIIIEKQFYLGYDIDRDSLIIDNELLVPYIDRMVDNINELCLVGGLVDLTDKFDAIILIRCRVDVLRKRLAERGYSKRKIEANIEAEIMNIIYYEAIEIFPHEKVIEVSNDVTNVNETCEVIISKIREHHPRIIKRIND
ncbi:MAG: adenylate kinase family protein [Candidatus Hodarchaeales archaeon]